jgi:RNA polymerase sigma-70 factor (ECF subfamily)
LSPVEDRKQRQATRSDEQLVEGIRQSSEDDFTLLYERYYQRIYNFSYLRLRNHADTEEVVQETFTAAFCSIDAFQAKSSLRSWIYGIAKNTVNNHIRHAKAREQRVDRAEPELVRDLHSSFSFDPEEHLTLRRCADSIRGRFAGLADWQVEIFELRHFDDLPIGEIAARTSRSNDAVRSSLCRVKRILVEAVEAGPVPEERSSVERSPA